MKVFEQIYTDILKEYKDFSEDHKLSLIFEKFYSDKNIPINGILNLLKVIQLKFTKFDNNGNIINENKNLIIDVPDKLVFNVLTNLDNDFYYHLTAQEFFQYIKETRYEFNFLKNKTDFFIFKFDFTNREKRDKFHKILFNKLITNEKQLQNIDNEFVQYLSDAAGAAKIINHKAVILLNENLLIDPFQILIHEFSHCFQQLAGIHITDSSQKDAKSKRNLISSSSVCKQFGILNYEQYKNYLYLFNKEEFLPHVDDLLQNLFKLYISFYSNISIYDFLKILFELPEKQKIQREPLFFQYLQITNDISTLIMFCIANDLNIKKQKINNYIITKLPNLVEQYLKRI